jgi:predicted DNA-binding transcriptional regulator AlpA
MQTNTIPPALAPEPRPAPQQPQQLLIPARHAARLTGVSVRTWWRWHSARRVPAPVVIKGRPLWRVQELQAWVDAGCPDRKTWEALYRTKGGRP